MQRAARFALWVTLLSSSLAGANLFPLQEGNTWTVGLDGKDEVASVTPPGQPPYTATYTAAGFIKNMTDPLGATTQFSYDALNRRTQTIDALGGVTSWIRNGAGGVLRTVDALGGAETLTRDPVGRVTSRMGPDGDLSLYAYDCCDRSSMTDPLGVVSTFTYSARHELTHVRWPGIDHDYAYDAASRLIRAERVSAGDPTITHLFGYDDADRLLTSTQSHLGRTATMVLNGNGDCIQVSDNIQPQAVTLNYNSRRLPVTVTQSGAGSLSATAFGSSTLTSTSRPSPLGVIRTWPSGTVAHRSTSVVQHRRVMAASPGMPHKLRKDEQRGAAVHPSSLSRKRLIVTAAPAPVGSCRYRPCGSPGPARR